MNFKNHLDSIKVTLMDYPSLEELEKYIPEFCCITWLERIEDLPDFLKSRGLTRMDIIHEMFNGRTLPTALETVRFTFLLEGLTLTDATHLIRHRVFSYSSQASDPNPVDGYDVLENDAFLSDPVLLEKSRQLMKDANDLYTLARTRGVNNFDARHYMPRAKECKYFMSGNIRDIIGYIRTRLGRQNQPPSDNILALRIRQAVLKVYPFLEPQLPSQYPQDIYLKNLNEKMNVNTFPPDALHRAEIEKRGINLEGVEFDHLKPRDEYSYMNHFEELFNDILENKK